MNIEVLSNSTKRDAPELPLPRRRASDAIAGEVSHYLDKTQRLNSCGATWKAFEKKITDVNIAAQMLVDANDDGFDTAFIISGDRDLTTPTQQVRERFPVKRLICRIFTQRPFGAAQRTANGFVSVGEPSCVKTSSPIL